MRFTVEESPTPRLLLAAYDPAEHQEFINLFAELPPLKHEARRAAVLTNRSLQSVTAIVCRWIIADQDGTATTRFVIRDNYFPYLPPSRDQSVFPSGSVLVTIHGFQDALDLSKPYYWSASSVGSIDADTAAAITVSLDSVVFEDGRILGPDVRRIGDYIRERYTAARWIAQRVHEAEATGETPAAVLRAIAQDESEPDRWRRRLAMMAQRNPSAAHAWLNDLPRPPEFFRSR